MEERRRRVADNEALFRSVNERVEELNEPFATVTDVFSIVCECGNINCLERIEVDVASYEATRAESARFLILPGHEIPDAENVVERGNGYNVVEKHPGAPQEIAEEQDPRTNG